MKQIMTFVKLRYESGIKLPATKTILYTVSMNISMSQVLSCQRLKSIYPYTLSINKL